MAEAKFLIQNFLLLGFGALGALTGVRVGIFNISVEASIMSALFGFMFGFKLGGMLPGIVLALLCGVFAAILFGILVVILGMDDIVSGVALNMLFLGLLTFVTQELTGDKILVVESFRRNFSENEVIAALVGVFLLMVSLSYYLMVLSRWAPRLSAIGFDLGVAKVCDIPVDRIRLTMLVLGGVMCSLGGIALAVAAGEYSDSAWREGVGYMSIALVLAGKGRMQLMLVGVMLFSIVRFVSIHPGIRFIPVPEQVYQLLPYIGILILFSVVGKMRRGDMSPYP